MRQLGYQIVDAMVAHTEHLPTLPVQTVTPRAALEARLREPLPEAGTAAACVLNEALREVFPHLSPVNHPRFFAFIPSPSNFVSAMAEALVAGYNGFAGTWIETSGLAVNELVVMDWLRDRCGFPEGAGGLCVSGGSAANLTALAAARTDRLGADFRDGVAYCSAQTHASIDRALRLLGFAPHQLRRLPTDDDFRLDLAALQQALAEDRAAGQRPFCVIANAGTTNTGAVDPLEPLADLCFQENLWLHVDGAYGASVMLSDQGSALLPGLGRAHSLSLDPHKWLFQPYEIGCVLVRDPRVLRRTFSMHAEYLEDTKRAEEEVNFAEYGLQLTRRANAFKLWFSLKVFGRQAFAEAIDHGLHLARYAETWLRERPAWEVFAPATLGIVAFRHAPTGLSAAEQDAHNLQLAETLNASGFAMLSTTTLRGRTALRLCPIHPETTEADLEATLERLATLAA